MSNNGVTSFGKGIQNLKQLKPGYLKIIVIIVLIIILTLSALFIKNNITKGQTIPSYTPIGLSEPLEQIPAQSGEVLVADTSDKKMYIDTTSLNIRIEDVETGAIWNSIYDGDDKATEYEKSPIIIKFLGRDSKIYEWSAYKYCISNGKYDIYKIKNGVRIVFNFVQTDSTRLEEYMPKKISIERFREAFLDKLEEKVSNGTLSEEKAERYKSVLFMIYEKDEKNNCYYNKFSGSPSASVVNLLIELSKEVGYTREMLIQDSQEFGITVNIVEPAEFEVVMEATLEQNDFVVRIPTYEIENRNDSYILQNIMVLPNFGLMPANAADEGYILVPDGAGALFKFNSFNDKYPEYTRPIYNNTYYNTLYEMPEYPEEIYMPVFGMMFENQESHMQGFLGMVEEGAHTAYINVRLGSENIESGGTPYNKVFVSFDSTQYSRVKVFGPYSTNDARYLAVTGMINMDFIIRYKLLPENASYFNMAMEYRDYLIKKYNLNIQYDNKPKLFIEVIGALSVQDRFLGIPYNKVISMTTYSELLNILKDMEPINKVISYNGAFNEGINNKMMNNAKLVKENGTRQELKLLKDYVMRSGDEFYLGVDLTKVYRRGNGFSKKIFALRGFNGKPVEIMGYNLATGIFDVRSNSYYIINPKYFNYIIEGFIKSTQEFESITLNDMGYMYYANYNPREMIDPIESNIIIHDSFARLAQEKTLAINNPNIDRMIYGKYAINISRESSDFGTIYCSIPFRQLVMNGLVEYTTLNVNMSKESSRYYILQALELGSYPKFTICEKSVDLLKNTSFSYYFSTQYSELRDTIHKFYEEYESGYKKINSKEIIGHRILTENVFETKYASGTTVIVNYNKYPVNVDGNEIEALGYFIRSN
ncbi:MAG: hypothetical protein HPY74_11020 [Firmicutes bacterium]|nr:hypothetical protein [Bacillota bacterium]